LDNRVGRATERPPKAHLSAELAGLPPGGTLLLVGHHPAGDQVQVSVEQAVAALDPGRWEIVVAEERPRAAAGTGVDAVIRARNDGADD
jgi:hypothetical protein